MPQVAPRTEQLPWQFGLGFWLMGSQAAEKRIGPSALREQVSMWDMTWCQLLQGSTAITLLDLGNF